MTTSFLQRPVSLYAPISRIASTDSSLASPMKPQVLTTMTSAFAGSGSKPEAGLDEGAEHHLGVHPVLRAAEGVHVDARGHGRRDLAVTAGGCNRAPGGEGGARPRV